jgi:2,4-dienoyl-CoA reductase-like NADH-dependent reductase (Old Yellow Enzyme family)/threonine dehydrogenase-like Zn-dependent dehydrogenase
MTTATTDIFSPVRVGTMSLGHRLVVPPHSGGGGALLGTDEQFERMCRYWLARVQGGMQWMGGGPVFVGNPLIPGFEPSGIGANAEGFFRHPLFVERMGRYMDRLHGAGGFGSVQMVLQGGMPIAPSQTLSGRLDHAIPHRLDLDEIAWLVREYGESAALAAEAGADAIELHSNHDDVLQWFLSPRTNRRDDGYGGGTDGRRRLLREVCEAIRGHVRRPITLGLRLCLDEMIDGGYGIEECAAFVAAFTQDGTVDYFSFDIGNNWGAPSYVPIGLYPEGEWAALAGQAKAATHLPTVYAGRVVHPRVAEAILGAGQADLVGLARALMADPRLVEKTRTGRRPDIRPCIAVNDCINRRSGEGLPFACAVNPDAGREFEGPASRSAAVRDVLVVGAGPAGTEVAALAAELGHHVTLLEREDQVGGQLAVAALARTNHQYADWVAWQERRLQNLPMTVELGVEASLDAVLERRPDVVVVATGAQPRVPDVPGVELPQVMTFVAALTGHAALGDRVVVVSEDDRAAPLAVADHLAGTGHQVTLVYQSPAPSPQVGKYSIGSMLARLDADGVRLVPMARAVSFAPGVVELSHSYSNRCWTLDGVDTVVLACGSVSDDTLYRELRGRHGAVHLLGDAYAPRRLSFATRQARELVRAVLTQPKT